MIPTLDCPDSSRLHDLLDGVAGDQDELTRHLDDCPRCQQRLETLALDGPIPPGIAHLGRWRLEAGPALADAITALTGQRDCDTLADDEGILDFLAPSDHPGSLGQFGPFEVLEVLGHGGMGIVLKALDPLLNRVIAFKVLAPQLAASAAARKRFAREARAAAAVTHPNVVSIHAVDSDRGLPYLVMEYVAGESLQQRLDREGSLSLEDALQFAIDIADGLAAAHARGIVHRDLKPANVLLAACGLAETPAKPQVAIPKITDFGLARSLDDGTVTQSGFLPGTPAYMAPEQARGDRADALSDLFSLGSVLYAMCTGRPPFQAATNFALLRRVSEDEPIAVRQLNPLLPKWLEEIMMKLHAKDPTRRIPSATAAAAMLRECLAHVREPGLVPLPCGLRPSQARRRRGARAAVLALVALLGIGLAAAGVFRVKTPEGTLVVEVSDPRVNVTVDGEDVTISGEGIAEMRLRTGRYKLEASMDGKPVLTRLVDIKKDGKEVVRVSLEPPAKPTDEQRTLNQLREQVDLLIREREQARDEAEVQRARAQVEQAKALLQVSEAKRAEREAADQEMKARAVQRGLLYLRNIDLAQRAWKEGQTKTLSELLEKMPVDERCWEWHYLRHLSGGGEPFWKIQAHNDGIRAVAFSPDGKRFASASYDFTARIWDVSTGKELLHLKRPKDTMDSVAFSPDGRTLATASRDGCLMVWDVDTGKMTMNLSEGEQGPTALVYSPDGRFLAWTTGKGRLRFIEAATGKKLFETRMEGGGGTAAAFSPDGKLLAVTGQDSDPRLIDAKTGKALRVLVGGDKTYSGVAFSPSGRFVAASGSHTGGVWVWEASSGKIVFALKGNTVGTSSLAFSPDGKRLAAGCTDGSIWLWDATHGQVLLRLTGHDKGVSAVQFSPDGKLLLSGGLDSTIRIWPGTQ